MKRWVAMIIRWWLTMELSVQQIVNQTKNENILNSEDVTDITDIQQNTDQSPSHSKRGLLQ